MREAGEITSFSNSQSICCSEKDLRSTPSNHIGVHNGLLLQFLGTQYSLLASVGVRHACSAYIPEIKSVHIKLKVIWFWCVQVWIPAPVEQAVDLLANCHLCLLYFIPGLSSDLSYLTPHLSSTTPRTPTNSCHHKIYSFIHWFIVWNVYTVSGTKFILELFSLCWRSLYPIKR